MQTKKGLKHSKKLDWGFFSCWDEWRNEVFNWSQRLFIHFGGDIDLIEQKLPHGDILQTIKRLNKHWIRFRRDYLSRGDSKYCQTLNYQRKVHIRRREKANGGKSWTLDDRKIESQRKDGPIIWGKNAKNNSGKWKQDLEAEKIIRVKYEESKR